MLVCLRVRDLAIIDRLEVEIPVDGEAFTTEGGLGRRRRSESGKGEYGYDEGAGG